MHITGSKNHLWGQKASRRKRIHSRENYSIRKSTANSAHNFYSENSKERESTAEKNYSIRKSTANQQRISTAKTAEKENLQQKKLQHQKIYSKTSREFLQRKQRRKKIYSKRKLQQKKNLQQNQPFLQATENKEKQSTASSLTNYIRP